ncbi:hypothetical protein [Streptomyces sp. NPDC052015]|uniref:hypothetical protein n=1 Tax=Streptomyces sp. NPDC052015 TaxID=3154755 RepID=UPI00342B1D19
MFLIDKKLLLVVEDKTVERMPVEVIRARPLDLRVLNGPPTSDSHRSRWARGAR